MLGAIIGDIIGSTYEFRHTNDYKFNLFPPQSRFTDDTVCTIAVADALLKDKDFGQSIYEWCNRYPHRGYGDRFRQWLKMEHPQPYGSFGNGSAMRVSPIGWYFDNPMELLSEAEKSAACTHNHPEGIRGAQAVAYAIHDCRKLFKGKQEGCEREVILQGLNRALEYSGYDICIHKEDVMNRFDVTCQGTVPVALWVISESRGFENAIRRAVSLGADADTLGAIVGSIAETIWGIPRWMKQKAMSYLTAEMQDVVKDFHAHIHKIADPHSKNSNKKFKFRKFNLPLSLCKI